MCKCLLFVSSSADDLKCYAEHVSWIGFENVQVVLKYKEW